MRSQKQESYIKDRAIIYHRQEKRPLTQYHHHMNTAAQDICLKDPSILARRGDLLQAAQNVVIQGGYQFKKGHSRSKKVVRAGESLPKKQKIDKALRAQRIQELNEDINDCNSRITFKEKRCDAASAVQNYKTCDNLTEEIVHLKARRRQLQAELNIYERKERKSKWYVKRKIQDVGQHSRSSDSESEDVHFQRDRSSSSPATGHSSTSTRQSPPLFSPSEMTQATSTSQNEGLVPSQESTVILSSEDPCVVTVSSDDSLTSYTPEPFHPPQLKRSDAIHNCQEFIDSCTAATSPQSF